MNRLTLRSLLVALYIGVLSFSIIIGIQIYKKITYEDGLANKYLKEVELARTVQQLLELSLTKTIDNSEQLVISEPIHSILGEKSKQREESLKETLINWKIMNLEVKFIGLLDSKGNTLFKDSVSAPTIKFPYLNSYHFRKGFEVVWLEDKGDRQPFIIRPLRKWGSFDISGYIYFALDKNHLSHTLENYVSRNEASILLIDRLKHVTCIGEDKTLYSDYMNRDKKNANWDKLYNHVEQTGEFIPITVILRSNLKGQGQHYNVLSLIIGFLVIGIIFFILALMVLRAVVIYPLEEMRSKAERIIKEKDLSTRFNESAYYAELYCINKTLNEMLYALRDNIQEEKKRNRKEQMLHLMVINHQVDPHFLFNTLNTVMMLVTVQCKEQAIALIKHLAKYYRACLSEDHTFNTLRQELQLLEEYIQIISLKNPDLMEVHIDVEEALYDKKIPRMILQTLVENCIKYGIKTMNEPLQIAITVNSNTLRKGTVISVRDNGKGMDEATRLDILEGKRVNSESGFGLTTIIQRIRLIYGIEKNIDILNIHSSIGEYTEVKVYIPWEVK